ncbi:hypothetical protein GQ457_08G019370 [Hibiscus cannabinus]
MGGSDMVLGVDWMRKFSPIIMDFKEMTLSFQKDGQQIELQGGELTPKLKMITGDKLQKITERDPDIMGEIYLLNAEGKEFLVPDLLKPVLAEYQDVFQEPKGMPPARNHDHAIQLREGTQPTSRSPFASPCLLVKKKDGSWRLCVDYRQLNSVTVKNKFPIPVVEDLLDELTGAAYFSKIDLRSGRVEYLGYIISQGGVSTDSSKIEAMKQWPLPTNLKSLRGFLGLTGYYRKFVKGYGEISKPLTDMLKKKGFRWSPEAMAAFERLKEAMCRAPTSGNQGGRPPDGTTIVDMPVALERQGSPAVPELQPVQKKGRSEEETMIVEDTPMEGLGDASMGPSDSPPVVMQSEAKDPSLPILSFKDMLLGNPGFSKQRQYVEELDVEVWYEDVRFGCNCTLPEIQFSDHVHKAIDKKLANSVVIRLLGRSIGYRALLNRIQSMWNPSGDMILIDLDNDYYLVRFALVEDFNKVLIDGPWMIYGTYLTVQPWSRSFSITETHLSQIMVWVRLPKLPYRYYTKSLFCHIAFTIGKVVRVDYNTTEGKRWRFARLAIVVDLNKTLVSGIFIDGVRQDIEYEGRAMPNAQRQNRGVEAGFARGTMGCRFEVLEDEVVVMGDLPADVVMEPSGSAKLRVRVSARSPHKRDVVKEGRIVSSGTESGLHGRESTSIEGVGKAKEGLPQKQGVMASQGAVVRGDSSLDNSKHSVVKVVDTCSTTTTKVAKGRWRSKSEAGGPIIGGGIDE